MAKEYRPLTIPNISWDKKTLNNKYGELIAQPLETGFGTTIGNALRRILLGGVEGSAVTSFILKGANNEFATIPGIVEDVMKIALNIKELVIRNKEGRPGMMRIHKKGSGIVTGADVEADAHLEIINKEHIIAHLAQDGECDIQFFVETGRGYQPAQWPLDKSFQEDGRIYLDAMFSPIKKVTFDVEKARVGKDIDFDKLILRISTDGSENPADMLHYAVSVLCSQLEHFLAHAIIPFNSISVQSVDQQETKPPAQLQDLGLKNIPVELLLRPIEELELTVRAHNCLLNNNITRIIDLVNLSEDDLLKFKNFGRKSFTEVKDSLKAFGLHFGMNVKEEDVKKLLVSAEEIKQ